MNINKLLQYYVSELMSGVSAARESISNVISVSEKASDQVIGGKIYISSEEPLDAIDGDIWIRIPAIGAEDVTNN